MSCTSSCSGSNEDEDEGFDASFDEKDKEEVEIEWLEHIDSSNGKKYYHNMKTEITQWDCPEGVPIIRAYENEEDEETPAIERDQVVNIEPDQKIEENEAILVKEIEKAQPITDESATQIENPLPKDIWYMYLHQESGSPYYFNQSNQKTQWQRPDVEHIVDATASVLNPTTSQDATTSNVVAQIAPANLGSAKYQEWLKKSKISAVPTAVQATPLHTSVAMKSDPLSRLNSVLDAIGNNEERASTSYCNTSSSMVWQELMDSTTGKMYYYHSLSGKTQWEIPEEFKGISETSWIRTQRDETNEPTTGTNGLMNSSVAGDDTADALLTNQSGTSSYQAKGKFNRLTGKFELMGGEEYWLRMGRSTDKAGRQMNAFFDTDILEKNRKEALVKKLQLQKKRDVDWKEYAAEKKAKKKERNNRWIFED